MSDGIWIVKHDWSESLEAEASVEEMADQWLAASGHGINISLI